VSAVCGSRVNSKNIDKLVAEALEVEREDARDSGRLGFMARALALASLPHKATSESEFVRRNGNFTLSVWTKPSVGLPYGSIPRLLIAWLTTEAVRTKERQLVLGSTLSAFMNELGLMPTGGRWGTITRLRDQMMRLFTCSILGIWEDEHRSAGENIHIASRWNLWWDPKEPEQAALWQSTVLLGKEFFDEITKHPVPIDIKALKALKRSPMALDIYCWLTHRVSYMSQASEIPWTALQMQFGAGYAMDGQGPRDFRRAFRRELRKVLVVYRGPRLEDSTDCLTVYPSRPHILPAKL